MKSCCVIVALCLCLGYTLVEGMAPMGAPMMAPMASMPMSSSSMMMYNVSLMPQNELPGVPNSGALGYAILHIMPDMDSIYYKVVVSNIYGPTAAHIHAGNMTSNGPVLVFLYNATAPVNSATATFGKLSEGTLTPANFIGPAKGMSVMSFADMYVTTGDSYVNVHTTNYPNGNIRGQISSMSMSMGKMMMAPAMAPMMMAPKMAPMMAPMMGPMPMTGMATTAGRRMLSV